MLLWAGCSAVIGTDWHDSSVDSINRPERSVPPQITRAAKLVRPDGTDPWFPF
jgi:hypothetical protein